MTYAKEANMEGGREGGADTTCERGRRVVEAGL